MKTLLRWLTRSLIILVILVVIGLVALGFFPVPVDAEILPQDRGAGASSVLPSTTGLQREFPPLNGETGPAQAELGRMLFFDPALSVNDDLSCAHCHHPDYGFADGQRHAIGAGGTGAAAERSGGIVLGRGAPSLWNSGFATMFFWDGRADSLEEQAETPITRSDEMGSDPEQLAAELAGIAGYPELFAAAYGDPEIDFDRLTAALAAFERTLVSADSSFDRYAAGDLTALSPAQRRGLNLFRSAATRCFECHSAPTFSSATLRVVGVPEMGGDTGAGEGAFKVPSLRNIALTSPYMHNGSFAALEEVVDFYANGGGRAQGMANVDPFVLGFELTDQEKADLVAFLFALTDEGGLPEIPESVPSGLPVVGHLVNPARELSAAYNTGGGSSAGEPHDSQTITVQVDETIQAAVDRAHSGDTVLIPPGTYHERVVVDISGLTLHGVPGPDGAWPTLDGLGVLPDGVISSGNDFELGFLRVVNFVSNAVLVEGVTGVYLHDIYAENTGIYGLYPVQCTDVLIERVEVTGVKDAGIYVGQSEDVIARDNEVYGNVIGIEMENTVGAEVYGNYAHGNTLAISIVLLPQLTSKVSLNTRVYDNRVEDNNLPNFALPGTAASILPSGSGIAVLSADNVEVFNNTIRDHKTAGLGIFHIGIGFEPERINVPANPENNFIHDNILENNGYAPDALIADLGIPGADILWDGTGANNRFDQPGASSFPPALPRGWWPEFLYNVYWRVLDFVTGLL